MMPMKAFLVAGLTLLFAGLALLKLVPRIGSSNPPATSGEQSEHSADAAFDS
jgi:hypothetical protein